jgi:hypothetical protein
LLRAYPFNSLERETRPKSFYRYPGDMLVHCKFDVERNAEDLDALARRDVGIAESQVGRCCRRWSASKVYETSLIRFERRAAPSRLLFGVRDNRVLNRYCVLCGIVPDYPCVKAEVSTIKQGKGSRVPLT